MSILILWLKQNLLKVMKLAIFLIENSLIDDTDQDTDVNFYRAFHPKLNLDRIIIQRSCAHSLEQLTTLNYFTREQLSFVDSSLVKMLKDMAFEVARRKCKHIIGKMF